MNAIFNILDRLTALLLAAAVVVAARVFLGDGWFLWAVGALAALSAWREAGRLYLRPMPPALRQAIVGPQQEAAEPLKAMGRRQGLPYPAVLFWPQGQLPDGAPAADPPPTASET